MNKLLFIFFAVMSGIAFGQNKPDSSTIEYLHNQQDSIMHADENQETKVIQPGKTENFKGQNYEVGHSKYDSRMEIRSLDTLEENNMSILKNAKSVGCLIDAGQLDYAGDSVYMLDLSQIFGKTYRLCPDEPYYSQPTVGFGTAFFIDNDKIITALHCFDNKNIKDVYFVLGYVLANIDGTINPEFNGGQVFKIKKIIKKIVDYDIVILQLDKSYRGFFPSIAKNYDYEVESPIYALGYPVGLPLKLATNASIKSKPDNLFIYTTLDTYQGNSGSPVFDKSTNEIIGILLEGGVDFVNQGNCNRSFLCARSDCLGEKVLMLSIIAEEIFGE